MVLGLKLRLAEAAAGRPALAVGGEVKLPLSRDVADLQSGAGTGGVDATARLTAQWRPGRYDVLASAAYTRTGGPPLGDRLIVAGAGADPGVEDLPLVLADRVDLGVGVRRALGRRMAAVVEITTALDVGARTATVDAATAGRRRGRRPGALGRRAAGARRCAITAIRCPRASAGRRPSPASWT